MPFLEKPISFLLGLYEGTHHGPREGCHPQTPRPPQNASQGPPQNASQSPSWIPVFDTVLGFRMQYFLYSFTDPGGGVV